MKSFMRLLAVLSFFISMRAQAQPDLTEEFITNDGAFRFRYPQGWDAEERDDGGLLLNLDGVGTILIFPPALLESGGLVPTKSAVTLLEDFIVRGNDNFTFKEPEAVEELSAARADFDIHLESFVETTSSFAVAVYNDELAAMLLCYGEEIDPDELEQLVFAIAQSMEVGTFARHGDVSGELPTLTDYLTGEIENEWTQAIAELERLDLIPEEGTLLLNEPMLFSALESGLIVYEESASEYSEFVMAGLISLRPLNEGDFVFCGLTTFLSGDKDDPSGFLMVGPTSEDEIVVLESHASSDEPHFIRRESPVDFYSPNHVLYIVRNQQVTVFVNGEAIIEHWPISFEPEQTVYAGTNMEPGCVMTSVWAYGLPSEQLPQKKKR
jgi:hypothetical protein